MDEKELEVKVKEAYETPELTVYGDVEELTQGGGGSRRTDLSSDVTK